MLLLVLFVNGLQSPDLMLSLMMIIIIIIIVLLLCEEHELGTGGEAASVDYSSIARVQVVTIELADHGVALATADP